MKRKGNKVHSIRDVTRRTFKREVKQIVDQAKAYKALSMNELKAEWSRLDKRWRQVWEDAADIMIALPERERLTLHCIDAHDQMHLLNLYMELSRAIAPDGVEPSHPPGQTPQE